MSSSVASAVPVRPPPGSARPAVAGPAGPGPPRHERYADAVRARRRELRAARTLLLAGPRELRHGLAVARLTALAELARAVAGLDRELRDHAGRSGRAALPALAAGGVDRLAAHLGQRWAAVVLPGVRRVFVVRGLPPPVPWAPVTGGPGARADPVTAVLSRPPAVVLPRLDAPPSAVRAVVAGAAVGGTWRLALLPAAALSAAGLPALGGGLRPAAVAVGLALLVAAVRAQRAAAEQAVLRGWCAAVVAAVRQAGEAELARRLLEVERLVGAALDAAGSGRMAEIEAELRALGAGPTARGADP